MKAPFIDLHENFDPMKEEIMQEIEGVFERCDFVLGKPVQELEDQVRKYCGARHSLGVASGTDALVIALRAAGIGKGDAVITTPFTFIATAESIWAAGAKPVFCDISAETYNLDAGCVSEYIKDGCKTGENGVVDAAGDRVRGVLPVHLYGLMADMNAFMELKSQYGLIVIEDAAQAFGARITINGSDDGSEVKMAGTVGDAGCISFYPSKNLGGAGDGGMIVSESGMLMSEAKVLHVHGGTEKYFHEQFGYNSRLDSIQAAVLLVKLKRLGEWIDMRRRNAEAYRRAFEEKFSAAGLELIESSRAPADGSRPDGAVVIPSEPEGFTHTYNTYEVRVPDRDELTRFLKEKEVGCGIYYPMPLHLQEVFQYLGYKEGDMPVCEAISRDILALPQYPELSSDAIEYVVDCLVEFFKGNS